MNYMDSCDYLRQLILRDNPNATIESMERIVGNTGFEYCTAEVNGYGRRTKTVRSPTMMVRGKMRNSTMRGISA